MTRQTIYLDVINIHVVLTVGPLPQTLRPPLAPLALAPSSPVRGHILDEPVDLARGGLVVLPLLVLVLVQTLLAHFHQS